MRSPTKNNKSYRNDETMARSPRHPKQGIVGVYGKTLMARSLLTGSSVSFLG
jgi:hypothetical protein